MFSAEKPEHLGRVFEDRCLLHRFRALLSSWQVASFVQGIRRPDVQLAR